MHFIIFFVFFINIYLNNNKINYLKLKFYSYNKYILMKIKCNLIHIILILDSKLFINK